MVILALGSNLSSSFGNRFDNINKAVSLIENKDIEIIKKSSFYETPSYPDKTQPKFINSVIGLKTKRKPVEIASLIISIEEKLERKRLNKNDPRTCDIDIIDYSGLILNFNYKKLNFTIPHKKMINRNFVLFPLQEIYPYWKHPITKDPIDILIKNLSNDEKKSILKADKY